jgi:hypothetical protein
MAGGVTELAVSVIVLMPLKQKSGLFLATVGVLGVAFITRLTVVAGPMQPLGRVSFT